GRPAGSYNIPVDQKEKLIDLLHETTSKKKIPVHLTERPITETLIKADFDFKFNLEDSARKYTLEHIRALVDLYHKAIKHYLDVSDEQLKAFVFERETPYQVQGNTKDGIHLMYPYI